MATQRYTEALLEPWIARVCHSEYNLYVNVLFTVLFFTIT